MIGYVVVNFIAYRIFIASLLKQIYHVKYDISKGGGDLKTKTKLDHSSTRNRLNKVGNANDQSARSVYDNTINDSLVVHNNQRESYD